MEIILTRLSALNTWTNTRVLNLDYRIYQTDIYNVPTIQDLPSFKSLQAQGFKITSYEER